MLGNVLVTKQTGPEGRLVSKLIVATAPDDSKGALPRGLAGPRVTRGP